MVPFFWNLQAEASGLVEDGATVMVACDQSATTNSDFSIVIRSTTDTEPTVVTQTSTQSKTVHETVTRPPREKTDIEKYQDMEESALDQRALEGLPSSSSSSNEGAATTQRQQPKDAIGPANVATTSKEVMQLVLAIAGLFVLKFYIYFSMCSKHHCQ